MKTYKYIILIFSVLLIGCDDFLTKLPETVVSVEDFYKTEEDFEQAIIGAYQPLMEIYGANGLPNGGAWQMGEMRSDNTTYIYNKENRGYSGNEEIARFMDNSNSGATGTKYNNNYVIIGRSNQILKYIQDADIDPSVKENITGQALFLRAFCYFDLIQYFGDVPFVTYPAGTYNETFSVREKKEIIYASIIEDLKEAVKLLPGRSEQTTGLANNGSAYTLLGNIYMVLQEWQNALDAFEQVQGFELLADYDSLYDPGNKNNIESIFEVQYYDDNQNNTASQFAYIFLPVITDPGVIDGYPNSSRNDFGGYNIPTPDLIAAYENGDKRLDASIAFFTGDTESGLFPGGYVNIPYIRKYCRGASRTWDANNNWPVYRYAEILLFMAEALNELNRSGDALIYLNRVHAHPRTGLAAVTETDKDRLREIIFNERRIELAFENKRWPDLIRSGKAMEVMQGFAARVKANPQKYYFPENVNLSADAYNVQEFRLLFPIPQREMQLNPELIQNPGYGTFTE